MRRLLIPLMTLGLAAAAWGQAQPEPAGESAVEATEQKDAAEEQSLDIWKWANLLILVGGLGYLAAKNGGPFYAARARSIRKEMIEAAETRKAAEARAADVERRLSSLETEIADLRAEARNEEQAEAQRFAQHSAAEIVKIQAHAQQEIAAAAKAARMDLRRHAAELAIKLAEQKIRNRMTPDEQEALARGFVRHLESPASRAQSI